MSQPKVILGGSFPNYQNFHTLCKALSMYDEIDTFIYHNDIIQTFEEVLDDERIIVVKYYRASAKKWHTLFKFRNEFISAQDMMPMLLNSIKSAFAEEFI